MPGAFNEFRWSFGLMSPDHKCVMKSLKDGGAWENSSQCHGCWCPDSLNHQALSTNGIDYTRQTNFCLLWGRTSTTCALAILRNYRKCKYMYYSDIIMSPMVSQISSLTTVYSIVYSDTDQRKHQSSCITGLCEGNSPLTGEFPAQRASNTENVSIWWRHYDMPVQHDRD